MSCGWPGVGELNELMKNWRREWTAEPHLEFEDNVFNILRDACKALLKKAAARTFDDLYDAISTAIDTVTQTECQNYFTAAGYDSV